MLDCIYCKSCENMDELEDGSVHLIVTSPPYLNLKKYSSWDTYDKYLEFIKNVLCECHRVLMPGAWICWNIQEGIPFPPKEKNIVRKHEERYCEPLLADTIRLMIDVGFLYEKDIVWYKGKGTATQKLYGSYPLTSLILISGLTEHIITARKPRGSFKRDISKDIAEKTKLTKKEWGEWAVDLWEIPPVTENTCHPAPFPVSLAYRLIRLNSFYGDVVLDPFLGSGTTAKAAIRAGRHYVGYEIHEQYVNLSKRNLGREVDLFEKETSFGPV